MPQPDVAVQDYVRAIEDGDEAALWAMMSEEAKSAISKEELKQLLEENRAELANFTQQLSKNRQTIQSNALLALEQGTRVELRLESGQYRILRSDLVHMPPQRPLDAITQLKRAVANRNYEELMAVLDPKLRTELSEAFEVYEEALSDLDLALIDVKNDRATVTFPGGTVIHLRRIGGAWLVSERPE